VEEEKENNKSPTCTLTSNPTSGTVPLTVTFLFTANDSDGNISSWKLDIDNDGSIEYNGTGTPPASKVHLYDIPGSYPAKLIVTDNGGKTSSDTILITVNEHISENQSPICALSVHPDSGYAPLSVTFSMDANDPDGSLVSWSLDINNDGTVEYSGTGNPSSTQPHTYNTPGIYTSRFTVIDNQGSTSTDTVTISAIEITENQAPMCSITASPTSGQTPLRVTFTMTGSDPDGSISSWSLQTDSDGTPDYTGSGNPPETLQHTYTNTGTYTAKLTVTDNQGATDSETRVITVSQVPQNQPPTCTLLANPESGYAPLSVIFSLNGTDLDGSIAHWGLDIDNNGTLDYSGSGTLPSLEQHTYQTNGTYTAKLIVTDDRGATDIDTVVITVSSPPDLNILFVGGFGPGNYSTIQSAIDDANPGDTVFVYKGTYYENIIINKKISLIGEDKNTTIIDGGGTSGRDVVNVSSHWVNISGFTLQNSGLHTAGITIFNFNTSNTILAGNIITNNYHGIYLFGPYNNTINGNIITHNTGNGIYLSFSSNNTIKGNIITHNNFENICLNFSNNNFIDDNTCSNSIDSHGIALIDFSDNNKVQNNICHNNHIVGIGLWLSQGNCIVNNSCSNNIDNGIYLNFSEGNTIDNNTCTNSVDYNGIVLVEWSDYNLVRNNICQYNHGCSIILNFSSNNIIESNTCSNNAAFNGIVLIDWSDNNIVRSNICQHNYGNGIYINYSSNNIIEYNTCSYNAYTGIALVDWSDNNTVRHNICQHNHFGGIGLWWSQRNSIVNNSCSRNTDNGIYLNYSCNNIIEYNTCSYSASFNGIVLIDWSDHNIVRSNICQHNYASNIYLNYSYNNLIDSNKCSDSEAYHGIVLVNLADHNIVQNNICKNNQQNGICIISSDNNIISGNTIHSNKYHGIKIYFSSINKIYHNIFINNPEHASLVSSETNTWDMGYPSGGNYWDSYTGVDINEDNIGDTPYYILGNDNVDRYPLMMPYKFTNFSMSNIVFCSREPLGYMSYNEQPDAIYSPGDVIWIYMNIDNINYNLNLDGTKEIWITETLIILDSQNEILLNEEIINYHTNLPEEDDLEELYIKNNIYTTTNFDPGYYTVHMVFMDKLADVKTTVSRIFRIAL
jgi:parallel beta-helix repeat protein